MKEYKKAEILLKLVKNSIVKVFLLWNKLNYSIY